MATQRTPIDVFISYAQQDDGLRRELESHLALLQREQVIEGWHEGRIGAGEAREAAIAARIEEARIIVLLVSASFLASEACYVREMATALERHRAGSACVIPVLARACDWRSAPFADLAVLPTGPRGATPVTSWGNRDEAWTGVARAIRAAALRLTGPPPVPEVPLPWRAHRTPALRR